MSSVAGRNVVNRSLQKKNWCRVLECLVQVLRRFPDSNHCLPWMNTEPELAGDAGASEVTDSDAELDRDFLSKKGARKGKCNKIIWNEVFEDR